MAFEEAVDKRTVSGSAFEEVNQVELDSNYPPLFARIGQQLHSELPLETPALSYIRSPNFRTTM